MKNKRKIVLSVLLAIAIIAMQFSVLGGTFSASATAYSELTGRSGFLKGVNIHSIGNANNYQDAQYSSIIDAASLGANSLRFGGTPTTDDDFKYFNGLIDIAALKGIDDTLFIYAADTYQDKTTSEIQSECTAMATQFYGKVKYYQLGNELENAYLRDGQDGLQSSDYNSVSTLASLITAGTNAIKAVDPTAKTVVNFGWLHYGYIAKLISAGATFDYIGMDFYYDYNSHYSQTYSDVFSALSSYGKNIIVCEANVKPVGWNNNNHTEIYYSNNQSLTWLADFYTAAYNNNNVIGFFPYELYDTASRGATEFHREGHYGLIDSWGTKKVSYTYMQQLYGGSDIARSTVTACADETVADTVTGTLVSGIANDDVVINRRYGSMYLDTTLTSDVDLTGEWDDWKSNGYIEFDIYIEDADAFKAYATDAGATFKVQVWGSNGYNRVNNDGIPLSIIKNDGWNHVVIKASTLNNGNVLCYTCVNRVAIGLKGVSNNDFKVAASGMKYAIANVRGTRLVGEYISTVGTPYENQLPLNGYYGTYNYVAATGNENYPLKVMNLSQANISALINTNGYLEFDYYVEDYDRLMTSLTQDVNGNPISLMLAFFISSRIDGISGNNYFKYDLGAQLKGDGWNHIVLYLGSVVQGNIITPRDTRSFEATSFRSFGLRIEGTHSGEIAAANDVFAIKNITATLANAPSPSVTVGDVVATAFDNQRIVNTFNSNPIYTTGVSLNADFSDMWSSNAGLIEFDLFVSDAEKLRTAMSNGAFFSLQITGGNSLNREAHFSFKGCDIHNNGWNHIVLSKQNFGGSGNVWTNVQRVIIGFYTYRSPGVMPTSECNGIIYGIANVKGTVVNKTTEATAGILCDNQMTMGATANCFGQIDNNSSHNPVNSGLLKTDGPGIALNSVNASTPTDLSAIYNNGSIEFDVYVNSYEAVRRSLVQNVSGTAHNLELDLYLSSSSNSMTANFLRYNIGSQITKDGWNHITLKFGDTVSNDLTTPVQNNSFSAASVRTFGLRFVGGTTSTRIEAGFETFVITNIVATEAFETPDALVTDGNDIISGLINVAFNGDGDYNVDVDMDISSDRMVELDVYLTEALSQELTIGFTDNGGDMAYYDYDNSALSVGWNHITVRISDFENLVDCDLSNITSVSLSNESAVKVVVANFYTADYIDGDANRDNVFNIVDLVFTKKCIANNAYSLAKANLAAMDLDTENGNYIINSYDLTAIGNLLIGKE